jgi:3-methylcrotonyl-CoA carboxylase alpha subunit/acetyl-CoA/propionyl-CoA carboxylase biotin carboxyl carrier protein
MTIEVVLVANRGEIALRVMRACRETGRRSVAIYTDLDRDALHVRAADEAVHVASYLDIDAVIEAARTSGADAIHPGYGFLSERPAFARAVEAAGLKLVGPSAEVMGKMGRKDAAREIAVAAGVPVVPTYSMTDARVAVSLELPYPVLVKAAAGGGGKGMRIVRSTEEYADAVLAAGREAASAFGDDTLLLEKYVEHGRHIEVQVLADSLGNVVHLHERDCSTQRRHQKVLEEAPAPTISDAVRRHVTAAAVALAREVGYENAGTVEFLLDTATDEAYFLEMNTRLQVEHPVTEMITGLDLVHLQLDIAEGKPLPFTQDEVTVSGHAIEARVYAEDSFGGFLPQAGTASLVRWPSSGGFETGASAPSSTTGASTTGTIRVDAALEAKGVVSTAYDPMLGKVIAHGPDRESARRALVAALDETVILGLTTNAGFLRALVASDEFRDATIDTAWLDHHEVPAPDPEVPRILTAWISAMLASSGPAHPFQGDGFRLGGPPAPTLVELDRDVVVDRVAGTVDGIPVRMLSAENHVIEALVDGHHVRAVVNVQPTVADVSYLGQRFDFTPPDRLADAVAAGDGSITAPMPGTVLDVRVAVGETVAEGDLLGVLEAMKMELALKAPFAGTVASVDAAAGDQVRLGDRLFLVEKGESD